MRNLSKRVRLLERRLGSGDPNAGLRFLRSIVRDGLEARPELMLVEPRDTDEATYAGIEAERALARGEFDRYRQLQARSEPPFPPCPPEVAARHGAASWMLEEIAARLPGHQERRQKAVEAALRRVGR